MVSTLLIQKSKKIVGQNRLPTLLEIERKGNRKQFLKNTNYSPEFD
jgi:hypothetical protein